MGRGRVPLGIWPKVTSGIGVLKADMALPIQFSDNLSC